VVPVFRSRFYRGLIILMLASVGFFGECYGLALLVAGFNSHGSPVGNTLFLLSAVIVLVISSGAFFLGVRYWKSTGPNPKDKKG
jgi:hypothetical protein